MSATAARPPVRERERLPPDFAGVALEALRDALAPGPSLVQAWLERGDRAALDAVGELLDGARDTLHLLGRPATARVPDEVGDLVRAVADDLPAAPSGIGAEDVARVLVDGVAATMQAVVRLFRPDAGDSAIGHVGLFNDMRAVRGRELVSDALVLALGIDVGAPSSEARPGRRSDLPPAARSGGADAGLRRALLEWFRAANREDEEAVRETLGGVVAELDALAGPAARDSRSMDAGAGRRRDVLAAARTVGDAIARGTLADGGAVRRLFAEFERDRADGVDDPSLLANLLYYVATIDEPLPAGVPASTVSGFGPVPGPSSGADSGVVSVPGAAEERVRLDARYELDRVRAAVRDVRERRAAKAGPAHPFLAGFRGRLVEELRPLRDWLSRGQERGDDRVAERLAKRLTETVAALELVGAGRSATAVRALVRALDAAGGPDSYPSDPEPRRLALAEMLLELDARLDGELTGNAASAATPRDEPTLASRLRSIGTRERAVSSPLPKGGVAGDTAAAEAESACIAEARRRVGVVGDALGRVSADVDEPAQSVAALRTVADALAILPLPEASALVDGLASAMFSAADASPSSATLERVADLAAAIHFYLDAVSHPGPASAELLVAGEEAIGALRRGIEEMPDDSSPDASGEGGGATARATGNAGGASGRGDSSGDAHDGRGRSERPRTSAKDLQALTLGALDALERIGGTIAGATAEPAALATDFDRLRAIGETGDAAALARLAGAAARASRAGAPGTALTAALREAWAVLPQLIEPLAGGGGADPVRGLDDLVARLEAASPSLLPSPASPPCAGAAPRAPESGRRRASEDERVADGTSDLDGTLRDVFVEECSGHLDRLEHAARAALAGERSLPDESVLRALHTLTGSAQTVDATAIADLVRPLQRAAVERQRSGVAFDDGEIRGLLDTIAELRRRLKAFALAPEEPSLDRIFEDEAGELLERLAAVRARAPRTAEEHVTALGILHTLKGGARAAARHGLAERLHELEAELRVLVPGAAAHETTGRTARTIATELDRAWADASAVPEPAVSRPVRAPIVREGHVTRVPESRYERLLGLAADVVAGQARLRADMERLEATARELELAAQRWRRLPDASLVLESAAARELVDDLGSVRASLGEALRTADTDGRRTARAGHALQQELVRARLERMSTMTGRLSRVVEDAAHQARRRARFTLEGGETTVDGSLARELLPALEHLVRNAVVHGIEPEDVRGRADKAPVGRVCVDVRVDGIELVVGVEDDGAGLDAPAIERRRRALGLAPAAELLDTIAAPGLSTLASSDVIGGHGLGIGAARGLLERAGGRLRLVPREIGTRFELRVPQRVPVQQVLLLRAGCPVAIPVNCVREVRTVGHARPTSLAAVLGDPRPGTVSHAVVLEIEGRSRTLGVESVEGYRELVVQSLGPQIGSLGLYTGGSALPDGRAVLLLDAARLLEPLGGAASSRSALVPTPGTARNAMPGTVPGTTAGRRDVRGRPEALVVDDSPTQRAWLSTLLGRCGFTVALARDGVEALEHLAHRRPRLLIVDLDMPRLDGHGLLRSLAKRRAARSDDADGSGARVPGVAPEPTVLVVTSRDSPADREAAFANGAAAFLAKPCAEDLLRDALRDAGLGVPDIDVDQEPGSR